MKPIETLRWIGGVDGTLRLIDQTLLPLEFREIDCRTIGTGQPGPFTRKLQAAFSAVVKGPGEPRPEWLAYV